MAAFKVVVVGGGGVGKSAITLRYVDQTFVTEYDPTIEDSYRKQVMIDGKTVSLDIIDTAGQEEYKAIQSHYWPDGQGFLLVYSITSRSSFIEVESLPARIQRAKEKDSVPMVLVGNKMDLYMDRDVTVEEGKALAGKIGCPFLETSAKDALNVEEAFAELVRQIRQMDSNLKEKKKGGFCSLL